ncbi:hypothetical protein EG68_12643 [Paragonimus skrjabini miyazakii]|uniref:Uncharacterized protein n=1 Tax=Paragonimus skrjabini miyazakii TaxID=59628 RepID=A0A8S9YJ11_9TREM|nr:hypothetical protein EG68_12643 [Paragonimus skrjabini miyazakii]
MNAPVEPSAPYENPAFENEVERKELFNLLAKHIDPCVYVCVFIRMLIIGAWSEYMDEVICVGFPTLLTLPRA